MSPNDGPIDEIGDLITGEAAQRDGRGISDRIQSDHDRRQKADEAAAEAAAPFPTSVNEPDPETTMADVADGATTDGRPRPQHE